MARTEYTEITAAAMIVRNHGRVHSGTKAIVHSKPGIKVLGAIDYMRAKHKYVWFEQDPSKLY